MPSLCAVCLMRCSIVSRPNRIVSVCYSCTVWGPSELLNTSQGLKPPSGRPTRADAFPLQPLLLGCLQNKEIRSWWVGINVLVQPAETAGTHGWTKMWEKALNLNVNLTPTFLLLRYQEKTGGDGFNPFCQTAAVLSSSTSFRKPDKFSYLNRKTCILTSLYTQGSF